MKLESVLVKKQTAIVKKWFDLVVDTYPADTSRFLKRQKDPFANPVGSTTLEGLNAIFTDLVGELEPEAKDRRFGDAPQNERVLPERPLPEGIRFVDAMNFKVAKMEAGVLRSILNPKGVIEETVLHLADRRNRILTIIINAYTGRFSLYESYVDVEYGADEQGG